MLKAVFIDRDGVVNSDEGHYYIYEQEDFVFNPDVEKALSLLKREGYKLVLVTNQGGVAKGIYSIEKVEKLHQYMQSHLEKFNAAFDAIYYCPHHHDISDCDCRKPKPGMILNAMGVLGIDPALSYLIGDSQRDIEAGDAAGLKQCFKVDKNSSILKVVEKIIQKDMKE
jgi:D-glycero-D-manno-heptose 1,7-bisphosphate phosphatase